MKRYFVIIPGLRGPEGQIWHELPHSGEGKKSVKCLFGPIEISASETIDSLMEGYRDKLADEMS